MEQNNASNEAQSFSNQYEVKKWLKCKTEGTAKLYTAALKTYLEFTKLTPKQLIDLAEEDRHKSIRLQGDPEQKVLEFYQYLTTDYVQKRRGITDKRPLSKKRKLQLKEQSIHQQSLPSSPITNQPIPYLLKRRNQQQKLRSSVAQAN